MAGLFQSLRDAASAVFYRMWGFVSAGARKVDSLWSALTILFHRYSEKLKKIASNLGASSYWLSLNPPFGFSVGLTFDI